MRLYLLILLSPFAISCSNDEFSIELPKNENLLVVDGWIYDTEGPYTVKISRSVPFSSNSSSRPEEDAIVVVSDNQGGRTVLSESQAGVYKTTPSFQGKIGRYYTLEITTDGNTYRSQPELLKSVPSIDSMTLEIDPQLIDNSQDEVIPYFPVVFVKEPVTESDFYRWKIYRNSVLFNEPEEIVLLTDRFINGNNFRNELKEFEFFPGDSIQIELLSISQDAYDFYRLFIKQTTDLGTSAGTNPTPLVGNISNIENTNELVIGYFGASAISEMKQFITE